MFRNSYLETYKNSVLHNKEADFLFVHLSQIYATLGSVISDLQYQFSIVLAQSQKKQTDKSQRNSNKSPPYLVNLAKKPVPEIRQENDFEEIQNKLMNYANVEKKHIPESFLEVKPSHFQKQSRKKNTQANNQQNDKRNQRFSSPYNNVVDSTQDFDALFLNPKEEVVNTSSNSRAQPPKQINKAKQSTGNQQKANKRPEDQYLDKLFGN